MQGRAGRGGKADRAASKANKWASQQASPNHQLLLFLMCQVHTSKQAIAQGNKSDSHPKREAGQPASLAKPSATPSCFSSAKPRQMHRRRGNISSNHSTKSNGPVSKPRQTISYLFCFLCVRPQNMHRRPSGRREAVQAAYQTNKWPASREASPSHQLFCFVACWAQMPKQASKRAR